MFKLINKDMWGDTIIEVLIALAILSFAIGGAYYTTHLSVNNTRDAQEHSEGETIAQTQVEALRAYWIKNNMFFDPTTNKCIDPATLAPINPAPLAYCFADSNSEALSTTATSSPYDYHVAISATPQQATLNGSIFSTYKIDVSWPAIGSNNNDDVSLFYRLDTST